MAVINYRDGSLDLWDDLIVVPAIGINPTGPVDAMTVVSTVDGFFGCLQADAVNESCAVVFQLPHTYQMGTNIRPHIHVVRIDGADNIGDVEFTARFRHVPLIGEASAWTEAITGDKTYQPANGANKSGLIYWELPDATYHFGISDQLLVQIVRSGITTGAIAITSADVHGRKGQEGSRLEGSLG